MITTSANTILIQLAMMKFHDRREAVKKHRVGKKRAKENKRAPLNTVVLHSMGFDRGNVLNAYDGVNAHFAVLRSGDILYLHDVSEYLYASHDFNARGIAIEFAGNPPSSRGKAAFEKKFGLHIPTLHQVESGRKLVRLLTQASGIRYVHGHKQSCGGKVCPGPHIWYNVGRWAVRTLGLSDGGTGYKTSNKYCTGRVIPDSWNDAKYDLFAPAAVAYDERACLRRY
jgi:hypothetical protein